jgi:hypothetical protein
MALEKYMLKQVETFEKSSNVTEVLKSVTFKVAERILSGYFVVSVRTHRDTEVRTHQYFEHRIVDEKSLNNDFVNLINAYHKIIKYNISIIQYNYETVWQDQNAIIARFDSREECNEYVNGLWEFIINQFQ